MMPNRPSYEDLQQRILELEQAELEHQNVKRSLQLSERNLKLIYNSTSDLLFQLRVEPDECYRFISINQAFLTTTGLTEEQIIGKTTTDIIPESSLEMVHKNYKQAIREHTVMRWEETSEYPTGTKVGTVTVVPTYDDADRCTHLIGSVHDITELKRSTDQLFRINRQLQSSIENMPTAYILWDTRLNVIEWNKAAERIFGYSNEEMSGKNAVNFIVPEPARSLVAEVMSKLKYGEVAKYSEKDNNIHKDGRSISCEWFNTPIADVDGNIVSILTLAQDITERLKAEDEKLYFEKQMMQTQKLESLGVLAGGIAHDFNNILMGILGYADLALSMLDPISPAREYVQGINDSSRKAADLVKQMLAYSGKGKFSLEPIDLNHLIDDTVKMLEISISKNAILKFNYSDSPVFLEGDPSQIRQIIMNLVINASDAVGKKSGVIALTTGSMYCDLEYIESTGFTSQVAPTMKIAEGMYTFFEVSDTGTGISKDALAKIFEPFFTTKFTGRGLGLSAVLGIVRGHHGMIKIYSEEGKGTTFKVLFPLFETTDSSTTQYALDADDQEWRGKGTFLIADDDEVVRTIGKHMIKILGFDVLTAEDGREAVKIFKEHQTDIVGVLLDLTMPHKDGAEVYREINKLNPGVKVVLTSGYNEQDATQKFVGKGLAGFIQKPYVAKELVKKIIEVMGENKQEKN